MSERKEHETIWLQPWCANCDLDGDSRLWRQDQVWDDCEECGAKPVRYVLSPHERGGAA